MAEKETEKVLVEARTVQLVTLQGEDKRKVASKIRTMLQSYSA
jgi:hypothetical protein